MVNKFWFSRLLLLLFFSLDVSFDSIVSSGVEVDSVAFCHFSVMFFPVF